MKAIIFAVKDNAVQSFQMPQFVVHIGGAVRWFTDQVNNPETPYYKHPEDYDLYELGDYDDQDGMLTRKPKAELIVRGKDLVRVVS